MSWWETVRVMLDDLPMVTAMATIVLGGVAVLQITYVGESARRAYLRFLRATNGLNEVTKEKRIDEPRWHASNVAIETDLAACVDLLETDVIEPALFSAAGHELDTSAPKSPEIEREGEPAGNPKSPVSSKSKSKDPEPSERS